MPAYYPGHAVSSYNISATSASPVPSTPVPANSTDEVMWYNTTSDPSTQMSVSCDVHTGGPTDVTLNAVSNLGFEAPTPNLNVTYGTIAVNPQYHYVPCSSTATWLAYGDPCTGPGINWNYTTTTNADEAGGQIAGWQLIHALNNSGTYPDNSVIQQTLQSSDCADGGLPYFPSVGSATPWQSDDSPAWGALITNTSYLSTATASYTFDDYFMYKPPDAANAGANPGAIWISLGHIRWAWTAQTSYSAPTPAPSASPDPSHYSAPAISGLLQPTALDGANISTPNVVSKCST